MKMNLCLKTLYTTTTILYFIYRQTIVLSFVFIISTFQMLYPLSLNKMPANLINLQGTSN